METIILKTINGITNHNNNKMKRNLEVPVVELTKKDTTSLTGGVHQLAYVLVDGKPDERIRKTKKVKHPRGAEKLQLKRGYVVSSKDNVYLSRCFSITEKKEVFEEANRLAEIHGEVKIVTMYEVCEKRRDLYTVTYVEPKNKANYELIFVV